MARIAFGPRPLVEKKVNNTMCRLAVVSRAMPLAALRCVLILSTSHVRLVRLSIGCCFLYRAGTLPELVTEIGTSVRRATRLKMYCRLAYGGPVVHRSVVELCWRAWWRICKRHQYQQLLPRVGLRLLGASFRYWRWRVRYLARRRRTR